MQDSPIRPPPTVIYMERYDTQDPYTKFGRGYTLQTNLKAAGSISIASHSQNLNSSNMLHIIFLARICTSPSIEISQTNVVALSTAGDQGAQGVTSSVGRVGSGPTLFSVLSLGYVATGVDSQDSQAKPHCCRSMELTPKQDQHPRHQRTTCHRHPLNIGRESEKQAWPRVPDPIGKPPHGPVFIQPSASAREGLC